MNRPPQASGDHGEPAEPAGDRSAGRLRPDAEPIDVQLTRHRAAFHALAGVTTAIAAVFFALFAAFDRPGVGLLVAILFWLPIVGFSWRDQVQLAREAQAYREGRTRLDRDERS